MKIAKNYRANRLPVAVWRHRRSKGALLRCGGLTKGMVTAAIKAGMEGTQGQRVSITNSSLDERFYSELGAYILELISENYAAPSISQQYMACSSLQIRELRLKVELQDVLECHDTQARYV